MNHLNLSDDAQADLAGIKAYITEELENPIAANAIIRKITRDIRTLKEYAFLGAPLSSIANVESDYRFLVTGNYLTFYRAYGSEVYVDRVLYGRGDYVGTLLGNMTAEETAEI